MGQAKHTRSVCVRPTTTPSVLLLICDPDTNHPASSGRNNAVEESEVIVGAVSVVLIVRVSWVATLFPMFDHLTTILQPC